MNDDKVAYRANDELAAAVRDFERRYREHSDRVIAWDDEHPGTPLAWTTTFGHRRAVGFMDEAGDEVPAGLSRAKTRYELKPKKTKAGQEWQAVLDRFNADSPQPERVFAAFGVEYGYLMAGPGLSARHLTLGAVNAMDRGVFIERERPFDPVPDCLTPVSLSEYYAAREAAEAARAGEPA